MNLDFRCSYKSKNNGEKLLPRSLVKNLSSFFFLVPCIFMCFSISFQTSSCSFLFVCYFPDEIALSSILRDELKRFASGTIISFAEKKISASFQSETDAYTDHTWRAWYNGSYTVMAKPIKMLELQYQMIQFLIKECRPWKIVVDLFFTITFIFLRKTKNKNTGIA